MTTTLDRRPFLAALAIGVLLVAIWAGLEFVGDQRLHNLALWQQWHPVTLRSAVQIATPVASAENQRIGQTAVQTERGVYFLTGVKFGPVAGEPVVVQSNERWDLYLCAASGERCMTIHSFCAGQTWASLKRDAQGRIDGCHAPHLAQGTSRVVAAVTTLPPDRSGQAGGRNGRAPPAVGISHPRDWAAEMGLPVPNAGASAASR